MLAEPVGRRGARIPVPRSLARDIKFYIALPGSAPIATLRNQYLSWRLPSVPTWFVPLACGNSGLWFATRIECPYFPSCLLFARVVGAEGKCLECLDSDALPAGDFNAAGKFWLRMGVAR
jgi:hypothetical protein